jgi:PAS domain S-box-containing protein
VRGLERGPEAPLAARVNAARGPLEVVARLEWFGAPGRSRALVHLAPREEDSPVEALLRLGRGGLAAMFAALPDLLLTLDRSGTLLSYAYGTHTELLVRERILPRGKRIGEVFPDIEGAALSAIARVLETGGVETVFYETVIRGKKRSFEGRFSRMSAETVVALVRDVTAQRLVREQLRESEQRLAAALEASQDGFWELDCRSRRVSVSPGYARLLGYPENARGLKLSRLVRALANPDEAAAIQSQLDRLARGETDRVELEVGLRTQGGEPRRTLVRGQVVARDASGRALRLAGSLTDQTSRKGLLVELRRSRDEYLTLFDQIPAMLARTDPAGRANYFNKPWLDFTGRTLEEEIRDGFDRGLHPDDQQGCFLDWRRNLERRGPFEATCRMLRHDGKWRSVHSISRPFFDLGGCFVGFVVTAHDITERKESEDSLAKSLSALKATLESTTDAILVADLSGRVTHHNQRLLSMWRLTALPAQPSDVAHLLCSVAPQLKSPERLLALLKAQVGSPEKSFAETLEFRDGRVFELHAAPQRQAETVVGRVFSFRDTTERFRADEARRRLAAVLEATPDCVGITDPEGRSLFLNRAGRRMIGLDDEESVFPVRVSDFCTGWAAELTMREALPVAAREGVWSGESALLSRSGRVIPVSQVLIAHRDPDGELSHFSTVIRDISERKQIEAELRAAKEQAEIANQAKSAFLAKMSHEIRTPMNGVIGLTELALDTDLDAPQRDYLIGIQQSADNLLHLVNNILDFSKVEAGKVELESVDFGLRGLVSSTLSSLSPQAARKGVSLVSEVGAAVPDALRGDSVRLRQVLVNLIGNALKFTESGQVSVGVEQTDGPADCVDLHFSVADTGVGIPPEALGRLFQAFTQADASTARKYGGTGLGLAICKQLVELMGGRIWVQSQVGQGSRFHFTVRLRRLAEPTSEATAPADYSGKRALVVDDNEATRNLLHNQLARLGLTVSLAEGSVAAVRHLLQAKALQQGFDVVVIDVDMHDLDGWELATILRADPAWEKSHVVLLSSAGARSLSAEQLRSLRVAAVLNRPLALEEVSATLARLFAPRAKALSRAPPSVAPLRILVAEDVELNQKIARRLIEKQGHQVTLAKDGREAVSLFERERFDLIFMDVQMPEMDGLEATRAIRELEKVRGGHVLIAAMTAFAQQDDLERCLSEGMDGYVSKPVSGAAILKVIQELTAGGLEPARTG